ncbi:hypothetical protein [Lactococcus formosensis]|uniref:Uncharacterized protein n=1 Tax=Lactococcus formosensis TaxID=1281486 RepID=A0A9Q9D5W7_9LACT|nr:hypothetical protein [Lactococcus formosensis]USJ19570.1 hypothetical protein LMK00_06955 [Lactococcus formosensis]
MFYSEQRVVTDQEAIEIMHAAMREGVKMCITPTQDTLYYRGQKLIFTVLRAKNRVLIEYFA